MAHSRLAQSGWAVSIDAFFRVGHGTDGAIGAVQLCLGRGVWETSGCAAERPRELKFAARYVKSARTEVRGSLCEIRAN